MKLISSKMENDYRTELIRTNDGLNSAESDLGELLRENGFNTNKAYVLYWTSDQTEDYYTVLIDGEYLISTEIDRSNNNLVTPIERIELKEYLKGLSRTNQVRLLVAQDLVNEKT
jgi:hypothetical protein